MMPAWGRERNQGSLADNFRGKGTFQKRLDHEKEQCREGKLHKEKHAGGRLPGVCDLEFALSNGKSLKVSKQGCDMVRSWF